MFNLQQAGFIPVSRRAFGETDMIMIKIKAARRKPAVCPIVLQKMSKEVKV
jgi:hypothetical protein